MDFFQYLCNTVCDCLFAGTNQSTNDQIERMLHRRTKQRGFIQDLIFHSMYRLDAQLEVTSKEHCV